MKLLLVFSACSIMALTSLAMPFCGDWGMHPGGAWGGHGVPHFTHPGFPVHWGFGHPMFHRFLPVAGYPGWFEFEGRHYYYHDGYYYDYLTGQIFDPSGYW